MLVNIRLQHCAIKNVKIIINHSSTFTYVPLCLINAVSQKKNDHILVNLYNSSLFLSHCQICYKFQLKEHISLCCK